MYYVIAGIGIALFFNISLGLLLKIVFDRRVKMNCCEEHRWPQPRVENAEVKTLDHLKYFPH